MHPGKAEEAEQEGSDKYEVREGNSDVLFLLFFKTNTSLFFFLNSFSTKAAAAAAVFSSQEFVLS